MKDRIPRRDRRETLRRLCVRATELLEDIHEPVTRGQAADASERRYRAIARRLVTTARDLASVACRIESVLESEPPAGAPLAKVRPRSDIRRPRNS